MKEYVKDLKKYVKNTKESWDMEKFRAPPLQRGGGRSNERCERSYMLWDLETFQTLFSLYVGLGLGKIEIPRSFRVERPWANNRPKQDACRHIRSQTWRNSVLFPRHRAADLEKF